MQIKEKDSTVIQSVQQAIQHTKIKADFHHLLQVVQHIKCRPYSTGLEAAIIPYSKILRKSSTGNDKQFGTVLRVFIYTGFEIS